MDAQLVELLGRHRLVAELLRAELEVAMPLRDRGIDLIAYVDVGTRTNRFVGFPIQMKAALHTCFSIDRKYSKFHNLVLAYVWNLDFPSEAITYALTYSEAVIVAEKMGYTRSPSWEKGAYSVTRPGAKLTQLLEPFRMSPLAWREKIDNLQTSIQSMLS